MATPKEIIEILDSDDDDYNLKPPAAAQKHSSKPFHRPRKSGECAICFCEYTIQDGHSLSGCGHAFCHECISTYIQKKAQDGEVLPNQMLCPSVDPKVCGEPISQGNVLACLPSEKDCDRYLRLTVERCVQAQDNMGCCPTAGCEFQFEWDPHNRKLECPLCQKSYCLVCRTGPWHTGIRCEEFKKDNDADDEEKAFQSFASRKSLKQCPKCKFWVEKTDGCDAMHCRCNLVFCYQCGGCLKNTATQNGFKECRCFGVGMLLRAHEGGPNRNHLPAPRGLRLANACQ